MNAHKSLWLALPLALMMPALGCNGGGTSQEPENTGSAEATEAPTTATTTTATTATDTAAPAQTQRSGRHHNRGSSTRAFFRAAKSLDLTDAQKTTVENLQAQMRGDRTTMQAPMQALHTALVAGVKAGNVDLQKLAPLQAAVQSARATHQAHEAAALNGLWAALEPAQRTALVANIRERQAARAERWAEKRAEGAAGGADTFQAARLAHLTTDLALDDKQQASVAAIQTAQTTATPAAATRFATMKANREALLTAFASDTFDARTMSLAAHPASATGAQSHAAFLAQLVPILSAAQRETLATKMQAHEG